MTFTEEIERGFRRHKGDAIGLARAASTNDHEGGLALIEGYSGDDLRSLTVCQAFLSARMVEMFAVATGTAAEDVYDWLVWMEDNKQ